MCYIFEAAKCLPYMCFVKNFEISLKSFLQVCRDPRWGRCYESYSEDPQIVQEMTEIIPGLQGEIPSNSRKGVPFVGGKYEPYGIYG